MGLRSITHEDGATIITCYCCSGWLYCCFLLHCRVAHYSSVYILLLLLLVELLILVTGKLWLLNGLEILQCLLYEILPAYYDYIFDLLFHFALTRRASSKYHKHMTSSCTVHFVLTRRVSSKQNKLMTSACTPHFYLQDTLLLSTTNLQLHLALHTLYVQGEHLLSTTK